MYRPVHWLENVGGDPHQFKTACGKFQWREASTRQTVLLDPNRLAVHPVTCRECLVAMGNTCGPDVEVDTDERT